MDISPDEFRRGPKNPPFAFYYIQDGHHHVTPFSKKTGVYHNSSLLQLQKIFRCLYLCLKIQRVHPDDQK